MTRARSLHVENVMEKSLNPTLESFSCFEPGTRCISNKPERTETSYKWHTVGIFILW